VPEYLVVSTRKPFEKPLKALTILPEKNELDQIIAFSEHNSMVVDRPLLIKNYKKGLSMPMAKQIFQHNQERYATYIKKNAATHEYKRDGVVQCLYSRL